MEKISIVVAVYNAEKTIKKCVDSLLEQSYTDTEIVLVNDCSIDSSMDICEDYSKKCPNIILVNNPKNIGVSATRNRGIEKSTGKYICFVDSDDFVEADYLEKLHYYIKKYNMIPICGFVYHDDYNHRKPVNYMWSGGDEIVGLSEAFRLYDELYLTALWNKLFDNDLIKRLDVRFDETISLGEDIKFSIEYLKKTEADSVYVFSKTLYHYTKLTDQNLMSNYAEKALSSSKVSLSLIKEVVEKYSTDSDDQYEIRIEKVKSTVIYMIFRDKTISLTERIRRIREIEPTFSNRMALKEWIQYTKEKIKDLFYQ